MTVLEYLQEHILCLDGGMGTLLQAEGLRAGESPEQWNLTHPQVIENIHRAYFDAGSNVVYTNTFGANRLHYDAEELERIIAAAVDNAKRARDTSAAPQEKFVALDIGPTGRLLKPYGDLDFEDAVALFAETVRIGVRCGVDLIAIETMNDSYETKAAVLAAKENAKLPIFVTNAYGEDGKLMTGADPAAMVALLEGLRVDALGLNCSFGPQQLAPIARQLLACASVPVIFKPNAGLPQVQDGKTVYDVTPDAFADAAAALADAGVRVVGGCCGTTPAYIAAVHAKLGTRKPVPLVAHPQTVVSSYTHAVSFDDAPLLIGERINPTGKKRFRHALQEHDMRYILQEGLAQVQRGVHLLDVNVGSPEVDEATLLAETVEELQAVTPLPLQLDTANAAAMERALRRYNGKALINSVNGKRESMEAVFPLVQKYGGTVVALTLDENGIPPTAEGRVAIARRIRDVAATYGIAPHDLVFDTLTMAVSAEPNAALVTLDALARIRNELGCHTLLGVSNVSFGLPCRDAVNSTFFAMALERGLSAAIMNPYADAMMRVYHAHRVLHATDTHCADYLAFCDTLTQQETSAAQTDTQLTLCGAVRRGLRDAAREITAALLKERAPLALINEEIIPALDEVGQGFEHKTVFLPQLLMSAEAAQAAFECIKAAYPTPTGAGGMPVVLATVHGDIHDIGKNIVRLLLENYGFTVCDLGKDVPPETVVDAVLRTKAPLVGLSALMTTTVPAMEETVRRLHEQVPSCRVVVGGAVLTPEYAAKIGADHYAKDAMETVRYAEAVRDGK